MIIIDHPNFDVLRFLAAPFHIAQLAEKPEHIEKFNQNFLKLMPLVIDDFIQAKEAYIFLGSTNLAIANLREEYKFYIKNVESNDPLKEEKLKALEECWQEFEPFFRASLNAKKSFDYFD